ncbi:MAG: methyltransferase domain-containing protein [Actinobacteria bacterium]|nr:methyltransferase domain-containing protein [Actinomycetota bacterium]
MTGARERGRPLGAISPARAAAWHALLRVRSGGGRFDDSLAAFPELEGLSDRDRALANGLVIGTVKRRGSLDAVLGAFTKAPLGDTDREVLDALRLAAFQLLFLDRVPAYAVVDDAVAMVARKGKRSQGFVNAVLRKVADDGRESFATLSDGDGARAWAVRHSCPVWLVKLLRRELGDEAAEQFLVAANAAPERCLRVNTLLAEVPAARTALAAAGIATSGVPGLPAALVYDGPALERSAAFREGLVTPQSRGSQVAGLVAAAGAGPGARVLDLCAAPGTKTAQLAAAAPEARITAVDADEERLGVMRQNLERLEARGVEIVHGDVLELPAAFDAAFDAVLLDAPCSGIGTLASRADLRWRRREADISRLAQLQRRLIRRAACCVRPRGVLTYAVCTLPQAETVGVVETLLAEGGWQTDDLGAAWPGMAHPAAGGYLLVLPSAHGASGFFVARLRRGGAG